MKIQIQPNHHRAGGVLILTAFIVIVIGSVLATYLLVSQNEYLMVNRSWNWNKSMALSEAGVEDAMAFINKYEGNFTMVTNWSSDASALEDHWTKNGNLFTMHRVINAAGDAYDVTIDNSIPNSPSITSSGDIGLTLSAAARPAYLLAAAGLPSSGAAPTITRKVLVKTVYSALFPGAITTRQNINLNGQNVRVDSFDSTLTNASIWNVSRGYGTYDASIARANGNVATDSSLIGVISIGQANIYGHVDTGPGGTVTVGKNGYAGPLPQSGSGIQKGYSSDDMNITFPPVIAPFGAGSWPGVPGGNTITNSGNYSIFSINNNLTINAPYVNLYVYSGINLGGWSAITIGTNACRVSIYVAGSSISTSGNATINNLTQNAAVLGIYGLPSLTSINFGGNAAFNGTIYAPQADFQFGGGGNNTYDFVGSIVANSAKLNGHANFHYDESLKRNGPGIGYIPFSWTEITGH